MGTKEPTIPSIKHYNPDIVDLYNKTWVWISKKWKTGLSEKFSPVSYLDSDDTVFDYFYSVLPTFFLIYSGDKYDPTCVLDFFYERQEESGAIRSYYDKNNGKKITPKKENPESISMPLFARAEFAIYNKTGNKKRLKEVVYKIKKYYEWLFSVSRDPASGLLKCPLSCSLLGNVERKGAVYLVDYNSLVAADLLSLYEAGDVLNDATIKMFAKPLSDTLFSRIRDKMWDEKTEFLCDLNSSYDKLKNPHLGEVFYLLSDEINYVTDGIIKKLKDADEFNTYTVFPTVPKSSPQFKENTDGFKGGCSSILTYFAIKGLEKKKEFLFASECTLRHIFTILESIATPLPGEKMGDVFEVYKNEEDGPVPFFDKKGVVYYPHRSYIHSLGLISIALVIENVLGLDISLPQKTVAWTMDDYSEMGVENFPLKRNSISIQCVRNIRGWEIRLESEKLYYFKMTILRENKTHSLPIPSGRCSLLPEKF